MSDIKVTLLSRDDIASLKKVFSDTEIASDLLERFKTLQGFYIVEGHFKRSSSLNLKEEIQKVLAQKGIDSYHDDYMIVIKPDASSSPFAPKLVKPKGQKVAFVIGKYFVNTGNMIDILIGNANIDRIHGYSIRGKDNSLYIYGGKGDDELYGTDKNDHIFGGPGNDQLWGKMGNDQFWGGPGKNTYSFDYSFRGHSIVNLDPSPGIDLLELAHFKKTDETIIYRVVTQWDDQRQEAKMFLLNPKEDSYDGKESITIRGFSDERELFISRSQIFESDYEFRVYTLQYFIEGQGETLEMETLLPQGIKEVYLPEKCNFLNLIGPDDEFVEGVLPKLVRDTSGEIRTLFGVQ